MIRSLIFYSILLLLITNIGLAGDNSKGKLIVKIHGLKNDKGTVKVALFNSPENYKNDREPFRASIINIKDKQAIAVFDSLEPGNYAVKAFHDENNNDDFDTNFLGIPKEDYGFSNNARGFFGQPSWNASKFILNDSSKEVVINFN